MTGWMGGVPTAEVFAMFVDVVLIKATLVAGGASGICFLLRRSSAATRHGVWAASFMVLLALPVLRPVALAPLTLISIPSSSVATPQGEVVPAQAQPSPATLQRAGQATRTPSVAPAMTPSTSTLTTSVADWVVVFWLLGLVVGLVRWGAHIGAARRVVHTGSPSPAWIDELIQEASAKIGVRRVPTALMSRGVEVPGTFGFLRPWVLLPKDVGCWPKARVRAAIFHELAHLKRHDYAVHFLTGLVTAVYWVNPTVAYAARRLERERERACDDGVVRRHVDPVRYSEYLLDVAMCGRRVAPQPMLSFASGSSLAERVKSLLDPGQVRLPLGRGGSMAILALAGATLFAVQAIEVLGVAQSPGLQVATLTSADPLLRRHAAWAMGESEDQRNLGALIQATADDDARVRAVVAWALGEIKSPEAVAALSVLLTDTDPLVSEMAVLAIGELESAEGLDALQAAPSRTAPEAEAWARSQIRGTGTDQEVFSGALSRPRVDVSSLSTYLVDLGSDRPTARAQAIERLGMLGDTRAVDPLLDALRDPDPNVRALAVWALDEINPSRDSAVPNR